MLHVMVVVFGVLSVALTLSIGLLFRDSHREMGKAMFVMLVGQSISTAFMAVFAYSYLFRCKEIPDMCQTATWLLLFIITTCTSIHLAFRMIRVENEV